MSTAISTHHAHEITDDQMRLIKATVAKNATNDELSLFLYRCKHMGLDPLKPGHIHFVKYGSNPGTIVIGIDGFRSKAAKTGKHTGTKRGIVRDSGGKCVGAWAEVFRSDWTQPAREEVSLAEYSTGKNNWARMPETMIKKVAEVAALRMAFPDDLGGIYSDDEMENVPVGDDKGLKSASEPKDITPVPKQADVLPQSQDTFETYVIPFGKYKGKKMVDQTVYEIKEYRAWIERSAFEKGKDITGTTAIFVKYADDYVAAREIGAVKNATREIEEMDNEFDRHMRGDDLP